VCSFVGIIIKAEKSHTLLDTNVLLNFTGTPCIYILDIQQAHPISIYWIFNTAFYLLFFISSNKFAEKERAENTVIQSKVSYKGHGLLCT